MPSKPYHATVKSAAIATVLGALLALSSLEGPIAWAQNSVGSPSPATPAATPASSASDMDPARANAALKALAQSFSGPEPPQIAPASPHRLELVRQYLQSANALEGMKALAALGHDQARAQILTSIKTLPTNRQAILLTAFDKAYEAADARRQQSALATMTDYYATCMTDEELTTVVNFYDSGLGYKMLHGGVLTREEREQNGLYMMENPALLKFARLNFEYFKHAQAGQAATTAAFKADFCAQWRHDLAKAHLQSAGCSAGHS